jgi:osmotically-inducible protein OsmY
MSAGDRWNEPNHSSRRIAEQSNPRQAEGTDSRDDDAGNAAGEEHINDDRDRYLASPDEAEAPALDGWDRVVTAKPNGVVTDGNEADRNGADWRATTQPVATSWPEQNSPQSQETFAGKGPKGYVRADQRLLEEVCERLTADAELDAGDVTVVVRDGEVTLEGTVPDRHSKHRAEDLSASVSGIRAVHNRLRSQRGLLSELGERLSRD